MFSRLVLEHSRLKKQKLTQRLADRFGTPGLEPIPWKALSQKYANLAGIEEQFLWGNQEGGQTLYCFLRLDPRHTLVWIEYVGVSDSTFTSMRRIITNGVEAVLRSQARWLDCRVGESSTYHKVTGELLGITVEIDTRGTRPGRYSLLQGFAAMGVYTIALVVRFLTRSDTEAGTKQSADEFFSDLASYDDPALYLIVVIVAWTALVALWWLVIRKIEVIFRA